MKKMLLLLLLTVSLLTMYGQEPADTLQLRSVETRDGNTYVGTIISETGDSLILKTDKLGLLRFSKSEIRSFNVLGKITRNKGEFWLPNPQSSRYFWAPNGYGLRKGEAYFQNIWVLYNQVSFGLTDYFSIAGGVMPLFLLGADVVPVWIVPKFSFPLQENKINLGTGAFLGSAIGEDTGIFGLLYGTSTFGSRDKNMSIGLAYGFADGVWMDKPVVNFSTMIRVGAKSYFISENYILPFNDQVAGVISLGGRSMIRKIGLDYSLWIPVGADLGRFIALPFLGITIPLK